MLDGETVHGMRSCGSIEKPLAGISTQRDAVSVLEVAQDGYILHEGVVGTVCVCSRSRAPTRDWAFRLCPHEPDDRILYCFPGQIVIRDIVLLVWLGRPSS